MDTRKSLPYTCGMRGGWTFSRRPTTTTCGDYSWTSTTAWATRTTWSLTGTPSSRRRRSSSRSRRPAGPRRAAPCPARPPAPTSPPRGSSITITSRSAHRPSDRRPRSRLRYGMWFGSRRLIGWLTDWFFGWLINTSIDWLTDRLLGRWLSG